jgi:hypothetical protein
MTHCTVATKGGNHDWTFIVSDRRFGFGFGRRLLFACDCGSFKRVWAKEVKE